MTAPTLTEFLLARLADDEERARFVESQLDEWDKRQRWEPWRLSWQDEYNLLCIDPIRAVAEVAAKRVLLEIHALTDDGICGACSDTYCVTPWDGLCDIAKALAIAYADHPDYDETWRQ